MILIRRRRGEERSKKRLNLKQKSLSGRGKYKYDEMDECIGHILL
jgi:hypothetical protein